jgi:hypothetical protein
VPKRIPMSQEGRRKQAMRIRAQARLAKLIILTASATSLSVWSYLLLD